MSSFRWSALLACFKSNKRSFAKSEIFLKLLGAEAVKPASYPKDNTRPSPISGSDGSQFLGQNSFKSLFFDHDSRLDPPRPCTNIISNLRVSSGSCNTCNPRGSSQRPAFGLRDRCALGPCNFPSTAKFCALGRTGKTGEVLTDSL